MMIEVFFLAANSTYKIMAYGFTNHDWGYRSLHDYLMVIYILPIYSKENVYECMTNWYCMVR